MKETYYFSHDYNARRDTKINALIRKHGMLGYGVFWSIIEDLYQNNNSMPCDYELIAYDLRIDADKVKSIITEFDLFVIEDGNFGSKSVEDRLDKRSEKSKKARDNARKRWGDQDKTTMAEECLFYVLRIYDDNEEFIKCGITTESVSRRYSGKLNGYNYELLIQYECDLSIGLAIENKIRLSCENYEPSRKFGGYLECYKINQFKYIKEELIKCECKGIAVNKIRNAIKESKGKESEKESKDKECINTLSPAIASTPSPNPSKFDFKAELIKIGVSEQVAADFISVRRDKKATNTVTAFNAIRREILKANKPADTCIGYAVERGWKGFKSEWMDNAETPLNNNQQKQPSMAESWGLK